MLKKKYSRKRINFQKSSRSGAGTQDIETTKKELEEFSFLRWLDSFIRPRKTKTNIPELSLEINESSNADDELENNGCGSDESEDARFDVMNEDTELFTTVEESAPSKKCKKEQALVKQKSVSLKKINQAEIMGAELHIMRDMSKVLNKWLASMNDEKQDDEDVLFGKLVAAELKSLPQRQKYRLKHEINNLIINYKLQSENDVNHNERSADKIQSPTFHAEVNRTFQKPGHWYNDMQNYMTP